VADKFDKDAPTFKTERSWMAVLNSLTEGPPNDLLEDCYSLVEVPFKNAAEMVATLLAVYHNSNWAIKARAELAKLKYNPSDRSVDIYMFISQLNSLADKVNIAKSERKTLLYKHVPARLNPQLLADSKNPLISYEAFASNVADSALAHQRAWEESQGRRQEKRDQSMLEAKPRHRPREHYGRTRSNKQGSQSPPSSSRATVKTRKDEPKDTRACFICKKEGHLAKACPEKKKMAKMMMELDQSDQEEENPTDQSSTTSLSDSENS